MSDSTATLSAIRSNRELRFGPPQWFRAIYVSALAIIALQVAVAQGLLEPNPVGGADDAHRMNVVGRQRMLSQQLTSRCLQLSLALAAGETSAQQRSAAAVESALVAWEEQADRVRSLVHDPLLEADVRDDISAIYERAEGDRRTAVASAGELLNVARSEPKLPGAEGRLALTDDLVAATDRYLLSMERFVAVIEKQLAARHAADARTERIIGVATLLTLLAGALWVFEPAVRRLQRQHRMLADTTDRLRQLSMIAERTSNAVIVTDVTHRVVWANEGFTRITGYSLAEVVGKSPGSLLQYEKTSPASVAKIREALQLGQGCRVEIENRGKDGREYVLDIEIQPLRNEAGELTGFMAIESDITDRIRAAEQIVRQQQLLQETGDAARVGGWELDVEARTLTWSPTTKQIHEVAADYEPTLEEAILFYAPEARAEIAAAVERAMVTGQGWELQLPLVTAGGRSLWVRAIGRAEFKEGRVVRLFGAFQDVTEAFALNEQLRAAKEAAEQANRAKGEFLANMSHEIRTPMTAILGYADLLAEDGDLSAAPPSRLECIATIKRNGEHLLALINDILDLSKIEAGKMVVERLPTDPWQLLRDVIGLMEVKAAGKGLTLELVQESALPDWMLSDPTRMRQILVNLVGNAIKFTELGGVRVTASFVRQDGEPGIEFRVIDTGIGMTREQILLLFNAFSQAENGTARKFGGTGLGLHICRRLAEMLGGSMRVTSAPGRGSEFTVWLPTGPLEGVPFVAVQDRGAAPPPRLEQPPIGEGLLAGKRILLAEDGPDNQRLIAFHLRKAGATVQIVENGRLAIAALSVSQRAEERLSDPPPFDLVLTDMQMPEMDGYEATRRLRELGCRLPIVALTANAMIGDDVKCLAAGCDAYLTKPIEKARLLSVCATTRHRGEVAAAPATATRR